MTSMTSAAKEGGYVERFAVGAIINRPLASGDDLQTIGNGRLVIAPTMKKIQCSCPESPL